MLQLLARAALCGRIDQVCKRAGSCARLVPLHERGDSDRIPQAEIFGFVERSLELSWLGGCNVEERACDCRGGNPVVLGDLVELQRLGMELDSVAVPQSPRHGDVD